MAHFGKARIEQYLLEAAFAVGCHWERHGEAVGLLVHPRLVGSGYNHLRPLNVEADLETWEADTAMAARRLVELGRPVIARLDPQETPPPAIEAIQGCGLVLGATESLMALQPGMLTPPPPPPHVMVRALGAGDDLADYASLWDLGFDGEGRPEVVAEIQAFVRNGLLTGETRFFLALCQGEPAGIGALKVWKRVGEISGIATAPAFRRRGIAATVVAHLIARARQARTEFVFLTVVHESPAQRLYHRLGFREAVQHQLWMHPDEI